MGTNMVASSELINCGTFTEEERHSWRGRQDLQSLFYGISVLGVQSTS